MRLAIVVLFALGIVRPGWTQTENGGVALDVQEETFLAAARLLAPLAAKGDPVAQFNLGRMYYHGLGLRRDYAIAAYWFAKSADQGHPGAQEQLGGMYLRGQGVDLDLSRAEGLLRRAADQGQETAKALLMEISAHRTKRTLGTR